MLYFGSVVHRKVLSLKTELIFPFFPLKMRNIMQSWTWYEKHINGANAFSLILRKGSGRATFIETGYKNRCTTKSKQIFQPRPKWNRIRENEYIFTSVFTSIPFPKLMLIILFFVQVWVLNFMRRNTVPILWEKPYTIWIFILV